MAHPVAAAAVVGVAANGIVSASTSLTTSVYGWGSFAASVATVGGLLYAIYSTARKRRSKLHDSPPKPADGAPIEEWEKWGIRIDQWVKDNAEDDN